MFLTAEPRRGSLLADFILNFHRPHHSEVRIQYIWLSQGGAQRAYPELLTAESLRLSLMTFSVTAWRTSCLYSVTYSHTFPA
ncbi:MAG: hypothetical protein MR030_05580 [Bacteroidales bacterium]|nr:hypothetical protein [Bacteroidales bacterium]